MLGLCCYVQAFSSYLDEWGYSLVIVRGLRCCSCLCYAAWALGHVGFNGAALGLNSCGVWAVPQRHVGSWILDQGIKPVLPCIRRQILPSRPPGEVH